MAGLQIRRSLLWVFVLVAAGAASWLSFGAYRTHVEHRIAVAYCGKLAFDAFDKKFIPAVEQFDRVTSAASIAPRFTLAPLLLRATEEAAEIRKLAPPPCAKVAMQNFLDGLDARITALSYFAMNKQDYVIEEPVSAANQKLQFAGKEFAAARDKQVAD